MAGSIELVAGEAIASVRGRAVVVAGHKLDIGRDGRVSVPEGVSKRLLAQSGWSRYEGPEPPGVVTGAASGGRSVDASHSASCGVVPLPGAIGPSSSGDHRTNHQPEQRRRGRPRKNRL